ncbi:MAG: 50S ribosomal protein L22 [Deltaproteobacteria bacterium]|nr:50S ribosomal protein L22 [Deltaproteobacteria bacterium]MCZ6450326.1 50S ribosomal protein L22 [Deltaproteobacteria bacterium]MCZ6548800.1 50S ribosomal protein L22 [Deltaproteobacteria bacterium]MCZ6562985.1 50S ribosomal protein L22 [Deltaproteobacteria bacterium]MCZ6620289.1 50S ribosomal protein L22 [Deltaproteobacteria bacterium]
MEARAILRFIRVSPRRVRLVVDQIRGKEVEKALDILKFTPKRSAAIVAKVLKSAIANAENTQSVDVDRLYVKRALVDEGGMWKRFMPRAMGKATRVRKRLSHITVVIDERE